MKKKLAAGVLSVVLLVGGTTVALGATDSTKLEEIKALTQQMFGIQKQIVDKEVEAGLVTQEQADAMKKSIDQRQQYSDQAIANGQVPGLGMGKGMGPGKGMRGGMNFNNGQPMTDEQIKAWVDAAQARLKAQEEAMKSQGTLTDDQIKAWVDAAQAQLKVQEEAMKKGTFIPGGMGGPGGKGMHGGMGMRGSWGNSAPNASSQTTPNASTSTN